MHTSTWAAKLHFNVCVYEFTFDGIYEIFVHFDGSIDVTSMSGASTKVRTDAPSYASNVMYNSSGYKQIVFEL